MAYFAIIQRGDDLIPIVKGGDGPDAECLATWDDYPTACRKVDEVPMSNYGEVLIFDTENLA